MQQVTLYKVKCVLWLISNNIQCDVRSQCNVVDKHRIMWFYQNLTLSHLIKVAQNYSCMASPLKSKCLFQQNTTNRLLEGVTIYKAFANLSSPANKSVQLWVKRELEIGGI